MIRCSLAFALSLVLALSACRSPFASSDESSNDQPTTEVGLGVHGWPLYERDVLKNGVRTDVLWPISSIRTVDDGSLRRADILFPIGHWEHNGDKTNFGVRPLFDVETEKTDKGPISDWDILWPLVGWRTAPEESRSHVFPLWWQGSGVDWNYQVLFPVYWRGADKQTSWTHLWPAYGQWANGNRKTQYALWPFFWHRSDTDDQRTEWDAFWPLFHYGQWKDGNSSRVFPIWWHERDGEDAWSLLFPLWFHSHTASSDTQFFGPFYGRHKSPEVDMKFFGGPLFITSEKLDGSAHGFDALWPLIHRETRSDGQTTRIFPILWSESRGDSGYLHAWPLYGRSWNAVSTETSTIWPLFRYEHSKDGSFELNAPWPLFNLQRSKTRSNTRLFPLFSHSSNNDGSFDTNIALLFNTSAAADGSHDTSLIPLFSSSGKADGSYEGSAGYVLSNWDGDGKGKGTFHILWRLVQNDDVKVEEAGATHSMHIFAVNPFYRSESNDRGDSSWSVLFSLLKRTHKGNDVRWRYFWFFGDA